MKKVYLAGAVDGLSREQARGWRKKAAEKLRKANLIIIDPTLVVNPNITHKAGDVVYKCFQGVADADILLVEMSKNNYGYIGTATEMCWAWAQRKPIIVWGQANRQSYFLKYYASKMFGTLDEALVHIIDQEGQA